MARAESTTANLIDVWAQALRGPLTLCADLTADQWHAQTPCPGWDVGDVVAHMIDVEQLLGGLPRPAHEPDWANLPHVTGDFGRIVEVGVDARRGTTAADLLAELDRTAAQRRAQLDALPPDARVLGPFGREMDLPALLRMRIFDLWVHEQDVRAALERPGGLGSPAALVAYRQLAASMLRVWSKARPPSGAVLHLRVTGPRVVGDIWIESGADGRSAPCDPVPEPAVTVGLSWPDFVAAASGRIPAAQVRARANVAGAGDLVDRLLAGLVVTP